MIDKKLEFLSKAKKKHGDKYDYSKVDYVNSITKVCIICPEHGEFWQLPSSHTGGHGCPKCAIDSLKQKRRTSLSEFISKANAVHNHFYDYSKVEYVNSTTKVCINCPEHGEFWQVPFSHLSGRGCPVCRYIKSSSKCRMDQDVFISRSTEIHKGKYDYSKVVYKNTDTKVIIGCPIHGDFEQTPHHHIKGIGCPVCGSKTYDTEEFIRKARLRHGDKYDYSKTAYTGKRNKVIITCPIHGDFEQSPQNHIKKTGCPECGLKFGVQEKKVLNALREKYNNVVYQYTNDTFLKGKSKNMSLDCFLADYNIGVEYQGTHHFFPLKAFGGKKALDIVSNRDKLKYQKCLDNGVQVFYVSFERKVPDDYFVPIYRTIEDLLQAIDNNIKEKHLVKSEQ